MEQTLQKKQYGLIDAMRFIAAFFVVTIHVKFPGTFGDGVIAVARFAVPFFFAVSGFFCYYPDESLYKTKIKGKIKHIAILTAAGIVIYFLFGVATHMNDPVSYLKYQFSLKAVFAFIVFDHVTVSEFLWFLPALIYVYVAFYILFKLKLHNRSAFLIPILLLIGILGRESMEIYPDIHWLFRQSYMYRNFLFVGLPFFLMGYHIRRNERQLTGKLSVPVLSLLMLIGTTEAVVVYIMHTSKSIFIGTAIAVFALFVLILKLEDKVKAPRLASLGSKYSLYIYLFHVLIRDVLKALLNRANISSQVINQLMPFVIFGLTVIASAVYLKIKTKFKKTGEKA